MRASAVIKVIQESLLFLLIQIPLFFEVYNLACAMILDLELSIRLMMLLKHMEGLGETLRGAIGSQRLESSLLEKWKLEERESTMSF